jgi:5-methylcytosine-specific restriction endonuclease McrA
MGYAPDDERARDKYRRETQPSKQWLKSAWWLRARQRVLIRDLYTCRLCGRLVGEKGQAHIDHITPHNECREKFHCDDAGLQTLCVNCHASKKQREERRAGLIR